MSVGVHKNRPCSTMRPDLSLRDARKLGGLRGEISANAVRNSEYPTEHLQAKYNYYKTRHL